MNTGPLFYEHWTTMPDLIKHPARSVWYSAVFKTLTAASVDITEAIKYADIKLDFKTTPTRQPEADKMLKFWKFVLNKTCNDAIGLQIAPHLMTLDLSALSAALKASPTVEDALQRFERYYQVISSAIGFRVEIKHETVEIEITPVPGVGILAQPPKDAIVGLIVKKANALTQRGIQPERVELMRPTPKRLSDFEKFYQCPVFFNGERDVIVYSVNVLKEPSANPNPALAEHIDKLLEEMVSNSEEECFTRRVYSELASLLPLGTPTLESVARKFHTTGRTLQRRLTDEGTSFKELLVKLRLDLACYYLSEHHYSIGEVAYLLGFSAHSNFVRFFRQHKGISPSDYLKTHTH